MQKMLQVDTDNLWSKEAEAGVLGSIIIDNGCFGKILPLIDREAFYTEEHKLIFQALLNLHNTNGEKIDGILLRNELKNLNALERVGGVEYLGKVMESVPSSANAEYYAKIVRDKYRYRNLITSVEKMQDVVDKPLDVDEQIQKVQSLVAGLDGELQAGMQPIVRILADVDPVPIHWFWFNKIPLGMLTLVQGDPGLGKSFLSLYMAAKVSTGGLWPDNETPDNRAPRGSVVILTAEDGIAPTVRPRLDSLGADVNKIIVFDGVRLKDEDGAYEASFTLEKHIPALRLAVENRKDVKLIVIDPLSAYLGRKIDSHRDSDVRNVLAPLVALAEEFNIAVVGILHLNKSGSGKAIYRGLGSIGFTAAARTVWLVSTDPDDPSSRRRLFTPAKHNILIEPTGLAFELVDGKVHFENEPVTTTSDEALQTTTVEAVALDRAVEWLKELLPPGKSLASTEVSEQAKNEGISKATLRRAKQEAGVVSSQIREREQTKWFLQID